MEPLDYLRFRLGECKFKPYPWGGEDRNLGAFRSRYDFIDWYCQPPGVENQPYRDRAFYTRELARVSQAVQPRTVVEFGTSLGIGTCLLHWLNPDAELITVDVNEFTYLPGDQRVDMGHLAKWQEIPCKYVRASSADYVRYGVDLCFIDGDHSLEAVWQDSYRAWDNRSSDYRWAIVWHDHNDRHPGVMEAVRGFCSFAGVKLQSLPDSDTVWVIGD